MEIAEVIRVQVQFLKIGLAQLWQVNFAKTYRKIYENYEHFREFSFSAKKDNAVVSLRRTEVKAQIVKKILFNTEIKTEEIKFAAFSRQIY